MNLRPGIYEIGVSQTGFITLKIEEYMVVRSTFGKMHHDFVLFGLSPGKQEIIELIHHAGFEAVEKEYGV